MSESFEVDPAPVVTTVAPKKRNPLDSLLIGAAVMALAGVAFAGGRLTAPAVAASATGNGNGPGVMGGGGNGDGTGRFGPGASFQPNGSFQPGGGFIGGGAGAIGGAGLTVTGSVVEVSATSLTLQLANGTTVTIPIDASTAYHTQASASNSDVTTGTKVQVEVGGTGRAPSSPSAGAPDASGAPAVPNGARQLGTASSITIIP